MWARKFNYFTAIVWLLFFVLSTLVIYGVFSYRSPAHRTLQLGTSRYDLQIADTDTARANGLSGRATLALNQGMVFVYKPPVQQCFWMKDMRFALDIIWLDDVHKVVHMAEGVPPESYPHTFCPDRPAAYVIELPAGEAAKHNVQRGDTLSF